MKKQYDLVVLGCGPAGCEAALRAKQLGMKVAVAEDRDVGGTCLNRGCIPTKAVLHSTSLFRAIKQAEPLGIRAEGLSFDFGVIMRRREEIVTHLRGGLEQYVLASGVDLYRGKAVIEGPKLVTVSGEEPQELSAEKIFIATGSVPAKPPIPGSDLPGVVTSDDLLEGEGRFFQRLVIIGGGVIGMEFATAYSSLGCEVTVLEALPSILPAMDREISQNLSMILKKRGVGIHTGAAVQEITGGGPLQCAYLEKGSLQTVEADGILIATGRRPNTAGIFADGFGVEMEKGRILINDRFETSVPGIYAAGDVSGGFQLAHAATAQADYAVEKMAGLVPTVHPETIPACVYTDPEIAVVGLGADEAKKRGLSVLTGKASFNASAKALIEGQDRGFVKLIFDAESQVLLGAQIVCARATDMIAEATQAVVCGLTAKQMRGAVHAHPTFSETVAEAVANALERASR